MNVIFDKQIYELTYLLAKNCRFVAPQWYSRTNCLVQLLLLKMF